jgi:hypothetical protein
MIPPIGPAGKHSPARAIGERGSLQIVLRLPLHHPGELGLGYLILAHLQLLSACSRWQTQRLPAALVSAIGLAW